jgi:hypothetical protein
MATKLLISDDRMLKLMDWAVKNELATTEQEYLEKIDFPRTRIAKIKKGMESFTRNQIYNACKFTGASADYIFGFTNIMMRKAPKRDLHKVREIFQAMEHELGE